MSLFSKLERHERLMSRMADANGADLSLAGQVGLVSPEEVFAATQACTGCGSVVACETHLDTGLKGLPDYCRNKEMLVRLAGDMEDLGLSGT